MQADEQKDLETNSLVESFSSLKSKIDGRTLYYFFGTLFLIVAAVLLFRYFSKQKTLARDAMMLKLESAETPEKLKELMEEGRGTIFGSYAKLHIARRALTLDGLEKIGTDKAEDRSKAAASLEEARTKFTELTKEFKEGDEPALLQESWLGLARAEEALVGLPTKEGANDSRGDADKAIDAYTKAGAIFADTELSKGYAARSKDLKENKTKFIEAQKTYYAIVAPPAPPALPPITQPDQKVTPPAIPDLKIPDPVPAPVKKEPEPKKAEPEPKKTEPEPKKTELPKTK